MTTKSTEQIFLEKTNKNGIIIPYVGTPCWEWTGTINSNGYGFIWVSKKYVLVHRYSYQFYFGNIPPKLFVCHKCDNPKCVNPNHLFLGTHNDNMQDMKKKNRQAKNEKHGSHTHPEKLARGTKNGNYTHPESYPKGKNHYFYLYPEKIPKGDKNGNAKLTKSDVLQILDIWNNTNKKHGLIANLARKFNVSESAISCIVKKKTWIDI